MQELITTRRRFIATLAAIVPAAWALPALAQNATSANAASTSTAGGSTAPGAFKLPPLPYGFDALEPTIDKQTMQIHHDKHHAAYVAKLNAALDKHPDLKKKSLKELISGLNDIPEDIRNDIRNHGGGHVNHTIFWEIMTPGGSKEPGGELAEAIKSAFGSVDDFKKKFQEAGEKRFGSGWAWLVKNKAGKLEVISTANQDNPLSEGHQPVLGNDVWEHAYYLKYQNKRADYLKEWWKVVNWDKVGEAYKNGYKSLDETGQA